MCHFMLNLQAPRRLYREDYIMASIRIRPEYVLLFKYDIKPELHERYFKYVVGEFVPAMQERELYLHRAWHVVYGDYPDRHIEFITEKLSCIEDLYASSEWKEMEERLKSFTTNYSRRVVRFRGGFRV